MFAIPAFGVLIGLAIIHLLVFDRIRVRISRDHPDAMTLLGADAWPNRSQPMVAALSDFVWKGKYKILNDPKITNLCRLAKGISVVLMVGTLPVLALAWRA